MAQSEAYKSLCDNISAETDLQALWPLYKEAHKRSYDDAEDAKRFERFAHNVAVVIEHNAKFKAGEVTWSMGINQFTDRYAEESNRSCGLRPPPQ